MLAWLLVGAFCAFAAFRWWFALRYLWTVTYHKLTILRLGCWVNWTLRKTTGPRELLLFHATLELTDREWQLQAFTCRLRGYYATTGSS